MAWYSVTYRHGRGNSRAICSRCYETDYQGRSHGYIIGKYDGSLADPCSECGDHPAADYDAGSPTAAPRRVRGA